MEKKTLSNGLQLAYGDYGKGDVVVLLHGFCGSSSYWDKVIPKLSESYRVITIDLRGHGHSEHNGGNFTIEDMASDIAEFIQTEKLGKVSLLGHSLGGYVTLALAEKQSNLLNSFGLIHSTPYPDSAEAKEGREAAISKIESEGIEGFVNGLVPKLFADENMDSMASEINQAKEIGYKTSADAAKATLEAMKNRGDKKHVIENSALPILLIAGKGDKVITVEKVFAVETEKTNSVILEKSGHMGMYEQPETFVKSILAFYEKNH